MPNRQPFYVRLTSLYSRLFDIARLYFFVKQLSFSPYLNPPLLFFDELGKSGEHLHLAHLLPYVDYIPLFIKGRRATSTDGKTKSRCLLLGAIWHHIPQIVVRVYNPQYIYGARRREM